MPDLALVHAIERATLSALPAPRQSFDGPFVIKAFHGGTGRGNAAASLDPSPDSALPARIARIEAMYRRLGLPPRFRSTPLDPAGLGELLAARGYRQSEDNVVFAGSTEVAAVDAAVRDEGGPTEAWMALIATAEYQVPARQAEKRETPGLLAAAGAWLILREDGEDAACLSSVAGGGCCGIFDLVTRPEFRRRGHGARLIRAAAAWGRALGATTLFAHVAGSNAASRALQESCGMREAYRYRYWLAD